MTLSAPPELRTIRGLFVVVVDGLNVSDEDEPGKIFMTTEGLVPAVLTAR